MTKMDIKKEMEETIKATENYAEEYGLYIQDLVGWNNNVEDAIQDYTYGNVDVYTSDLKNWLANEINSSEAMEMVMELGLVSNTDYRLDDHIRMAQGYQRTEALMSELEDIKRCLVYKTFLNEDYIPNNLDDIEYLVDDLENISDLSEMVEEFMTEEI